MSVDDRDVLKMPVSEASVSTVPIPHEDVLAGSPTASTAILRTSADAVVRHGVWHCTPGVFYLPHKQEETVTIVEGRATVTPEGGRAVTLVAGDTAFFPAGNRVRWDIHETVRKSFHFLDPAVFSNGVKPAET